MSLLAFLARMVSKKKKNLYDSRRETGRMEIPAIPQAPSPLSAVGAGRLEGKALGTGADVPQPPSSSCLCCGSSPPPAGLVKTPHSEAQSHRRAHRARAPAASVMTCLPVSVGSPCQTQLSQRTRAMSCSHLPVFCSHTLPGTQQGR